MHTTVYKEVATNFDLSYLQFDEFPSSSAPTVVTARPPTDIRNVGISNKTLPAQIHQNGIGGALAFSGPSFLPLKLLRNRTASITVHD
jgi:hypothetical protein